MKEDRDWTKKPRCVLCDEEAITTAAGILVCEKHHDQYKCEAMCYLPMSQRIFYQRLLRAERSRQKRDEQESI